MKKYLKRLNWSGAGIMLCVAAAGAASRKQDDSLFESFIVFLIIGIPVALIFLFVGMEPKD